MRRKYHRLIQVAKDRAEEALRAAISYANDTINILYQRDHTNTDLLQLQAEHIVQSAEQREPFIRDDSANLRADLELYDKFVLIHWYQEQVILSFEPVAAQRLSGFIEECNLALE